MPRLHAYFLLAGLALGNVAPVRAADTRAALSAAPSLATVFTVANATGIVEGIASRDVTGEVFLGDVRHRCLWRRGRDGTVAPFGPASGTLFGVFGLAVDEPRHRLWAATTMLPECDGFTPADRGAAALVALDLDSGALLAAYPAPRDGRDHVLGDLLLASDGSLYVSDSAAPVIWRLPPGSDALESWVESSSWRSLQGLAFATGHTLVVSDYPTGLWRIDLERRTVAPLSAPATALLRGLDGLLRLPGGDLLAVQNGTTPQRVLRLTLDDSAHRIASVQTLAEATADFDDLTLLAFVGGRPCVIAVSGWAAAVPSPAPIPAHPVRIVALGNP